MIAGIFEILLVIALGVIFILLFGILRALPFMTGLLGSLFLLLVFPGLKDIIPGETKLSVVITLILAFVFLHEQFTAKSIIGCILIGAGTLLMVV